MKKRILLVEDEVLIALATKKKLEEKGYEVIHAKNGELAIDYALKLSPDLILMDINLGSGIDGTEAAKRIIDEIDVPIIFHSSHSEEEVVKKTEGITSYGYVIKNSGDFVLNASIKMAFRLHEAKQGKKKLNELLIKTTENLPGMVYQYQMFKSGESRFPFSTEKIWDIYEVKPEDVIEDASIVYEKIHPDDYEKVVDTIQHSYENMTTWECDYRVILPSQGEKWVRGLANPEALEDSILWHGYIGDITERKKHEESIKSLTTAVEQSPSGIIITDKDGNIEYVNKKIAENTQYSKEELIGKNPNIFSSGNQDEYFYEKLWETVLSGNAWFGEMLNKKKNGEHFWEHAIISPVKDKDGNIIKMIGMKEDITKLKENESVKETLLREIHHRVKNNFAAIESMLSLQMDKTSNEEAKTSLLDAKGRVSSMRVVYDKLLETNDYDTINVKNYFENFIEAIVTVFQNGSGITIEKNIDDFDLTSKYMFPLGVIVNEFITNSMKYAFKGKEKGSIFLNIYKNDDIIKVKLKDDGIGIPDEVIYKENDSFGLLLIHSMCAQIGSEYSMFNNYGLELNIEFNI